MRLHLVGLPHTELTDDFSWCAFTSLAKTFATMMTGQGHEVIVYWGTENQAECAEFVSCHDEADATPSTPDFSPESFAPMNRRVIAEMNERVEPHDLVLLTSGHAQSAISMMFPHHIQVEPMVGYAGTVAQHRVFPSYAWMHMLYSRWATESPQAVMGQMQDAVIPHFMEADAFPAGDGAGGYLLFAARLNWDKGTQYAVDISQRTGIPLKIIGAGTPPEHGEYLGVVGPKERADLMGGAIATLSPSLYCEPFCLVAVESQMCGTPAITTDFGAFPETVEHGYSGFRCRTLDDFCEAAVDATALDRQEIRWRAQGLYSTEAAAPQYTDYFERLSTLWSEGGS